MAGAPTASAHWLGSHAPGGALARALHSQVSTSGLAAATRHVWLGGKQTLMTLRSTAATALLPSWQQTDRQPPQRGSVACSGPARRRFPPQVARA